jgi:hypothetical protein
MKTYVIYSTLEGHLGRIEAEDADEALRLYWYSLCGEFDREKFERTVDAYEYMPRK